MGATRADFSGYATKAGLKCSDGRTITPDAFKHMDGMQVPLVYQHAHNDINNVLGHAVLEAKPDGMYAYGHFNGTPAGQAAKAMVQHGDIKAMSIYANQLVEKAGQVLHGIIREVSLVLAGANPGAKIDWVQVQHGDGTIEDASDEAVITTGLELKHADQSGDDSGPTVQEVYDSMNSEQQGVVAFMVAKALEAAGVKHSDESDDDTSNDDENTDDESINDQKSEDGVSDDENDNTDEDNLNHQEGADGMSRNVFEQNGTDKGPQKHVLTHDAMRGIMADAEKCGSLKEATEAYALKHGIENIEVLFPDARNLDQTPQFNSRRMEWVPGVLNGTSHTPFSRVKTVTADITQEEARALGYIKGHYKKEEWFSVTKRTTGPVTVYKKQKLDRDDIIDITDFDVVAWMRREMRMMLEEELARAILIGDGRDVSDEDKIKDPMAATSGDGIRSIVNEHELFATTVNVNLGTTNDYYQAIEDILRARRYYKGTGMPTFYTTEQVLTEMLLLKDETNSNRRLYSSVADLAAALRVSAIVPVEVMETMPDLVGIIVNLADYNIGADKGGEVNLFDDFDIDYNQYKYLIETRVSGALTKIKSALVIKKVAASDTLATPTVPTFVKSTGVVTIPTAEGVVYTNAADGTTLTAGAQTALNPGESMTVKAVPATGYYFSTNAADEWTFKRPSA